MYDGRHKYNVTTVNQLDVINMVLKEARSLPVTTLVDCMAHYENEVAMRNDFLTKVRQLLMDTGDVSQPFEANTYS